MTDLQAYGLMESPEPPEREALPGRVIELQRDLLTVMTPKGQVTAVLKGAFYQGALDRADFPCVGDFVWLHHNPQGNSMISAVMPRRTKFSRADFSGHGVGYVKTVLEQVVAANFDYVFILSSLNQDFNVSRIMRYLTQAQQSGGQPVIILTKADLCIDQEEFTQQVAQAAPNLPVHAVSSHTGWGMEGLDLYLQPGKTVVFLGMSGVGKSSLLNALMEQEVMAVQAIREEDSRGRHTTTHRQLFMLPSGAMVIDTPGMRELGLFDAQEGIRAGFSDVEELFVQCRFSDCRHKNEPGCAVQAALEEGTLSAQRWERYLAQKRESRFVEDRAGYYRDKKARFKSMAKGKQEKKQKKGSWGDDA